jgi:2-phosphosulfolactate phosphatase
VFDDQADYAERFEWGEAGVDRLAPISDVLVVVDVLSFSTAVDIAVGRGATVYPYHLRDDSARAYADEVGAVLAAGGRTGTPDGSYSLSPVSLLTIRAGTRLVLPSPNGATLTLRAAERGAAVLAGCLRNATAVAAACRALGGSVAVIAAGERWVEAGALTGSLRPAVEDLAGAGAILAALSPSKPSPEAVAAMAAFRAVSDDLDSVIKGCGSGRELAERGFAGDLDLAAELDASSSAPSLFDGAFTPYPPRPG